MKKLNIILGVLLIVMGAYFLIDNGSKMLGVIFCISGITSVVTDILFSANEPNDERRQAIKLRNGHISYLFSIIFTFIILLLFNYAVIKDPLNGFLLILAGNVLVFPLTLFYYNKTM
ncbi:MAG: hypothetical protein ABF649_08915 [Bacillus sp. (in: firmicutes)]